jgi:hypothetical protein
MLPSLAHLLHRVWSTWIVQMASSTPAQAFAASVFAVTQLIKSLRNIRIDGRFSLSTLKQFWKDHWQSNIRDGVLALVVVGVIDAAWLTGKTVYADHQYFVQTVARLRLERDDWRNKAVEYEQKSNQPKTLVQPEVTDTAKLLSEYRKLMTQTQKQQSAVSQSPLKTEIVDLSTRMTRFAEHLKKIQPQRPPELRGPMNRFRNPNTPEFAKFQKWQDEEKKFIDDGRKQFTDRFNAKLESVFTKLSDQEIDIEGLRTVCSINSVANPDTLEICGARLLQVAMTNVLN